MFIEIKEIVSKIGIEIIYVRENINDINLLTIPDHCGVYIIVTESGKRYVGSSTNIYRRIMVHKCNAKFKQFTEPIKSVSVYLVEEEEHARILEKLFVKKLNPELNRYRFVKEKSKTAPLHDNIHKLIKDAQEILYEKYGIRLSISKIIDYALPLDFNEIVEEVVKNLKLKI